MARNRVAVLDNGSVFTSAVLSLLREYPGMELLPIRPDGETFYERIRAIAPRVIIADIGSLEAESGVAIARLLRALPGARVICLGMDRPDLEVYDSRRVESAGLTELLAMLGRRRRLEGREAVPAGGRPTRGQEPQDKEVGQRARRRNGPPHPREQPRATA